MERYKFYTTKNKVIAVSTYAGKTVKGVAKCNPEDTFDVEKGKELAAARCNEKIAKKRVKRAKEKYNEAIKNTQAAELKEEKMACYFEDSIDNYANAKEKVRTILETI